MHKSLLLAFYASLASAAYTLQDNYAPSNFANMFDFFTGSDPTNGYVTYIDQPTAQNSGLFKATSNSVYMGVDHTNVVKNGGRQSMRLSSKNIYNHGLFILDLAHMPGGQCGTWPAFWMTGPNWPNSGELDIIEGVNSQPANDMSLHTFAGCSINNSGGFSGDLAYSNCDINAANQPGNVGCSIHSSDSKSFGTGFNGAGGGVYATEWTSTYINIWYFPRAAIPSDILSGAPNPAGWGFPSASFAGACNLDDHVKNQQIMFDITFCGDWAGGVWSSDPVCSKKASSCQAFVQNNPSAFTDTYWQINSLKVYQQSSGSAASPSSAPPASQGGGQGTPTTLLTLTSLPASIKAQGNAPIQAAAATTTLSSTGDVQSSSDIPSYEPTVYSTSFVTVTVQAPIVAPTPSSAFFSTETVIATITVTVAT